MLRRGALFGFSALCGDHITPRLSSNMMICRRDSHDDDGEGRDGVGSADSLAILPQRTMSNV